MVARDPIGVRPLFYQRQQNNIVFASEAKAIISLNDTAVIECFISVGRYRKYDTTISQGSYGLIKITKFDRIESIDIERYLPDTLYNNPSIIIDKDCREFLINHTRETLDKAVTKD